jgi:hypothetical protein
MNLYQQPLAEQPLFDPIVISWLALAVSVLSALFSGIVAWVEVGKYTRERAKIKASVTIEMSYADEYGGTTTIHGAALLGPMSSPLDADPYFVISGTNVGHRPVELKGLYGVTGVLPSKHHELDFNTNNARLGEAESTRIISGLAPHVLKMRKLVLYSTTDRWTVDKRSLKHALTIASTFAESRSRESVVDNST